MKKLILTISLLIFGLLSGFSQTYVLWGFGNFYDVTPGGGFPPAGPTYVLRSAPTAADAAKDFDVTSASCEITADATVNDLELNNDNGTGGLTITNNATLTISGNTHLNSGTTITINSGATLIVTDNITNSGTIIVADGGNLVQTGSGFASGSVQVTQSGSATSTTYNFWSSPITSGSIATNFSGVNMCDVYSYSSSGEEWTRLASQSLCEPITAADLSDGMTVARGYMIPGGGTTTFTGTVNTGTQTISGSSTGDGWNLVGNPYPSAIDADDFIAANTNTTGTLYFWVDDGSSGGSYTNDDYATYNPVGSANGVTPNGSIAVGQGFFVSLSSGSSISFTNSMRGGDNTQFFKSEHPIQRTWLSANNAQFTSQILIAFTENATDQEDWAMDSKSYSTSDNFVFGSLIDNQTDHYAIQSLSENDLVSQKEVPLKIKSAQAGVTHIQLDKTENLDTNIVVFIKDKSTGKIQNLAEGPFSAYLDANQDYSNRFAVIFQNANGPVPTSVNEVEASHLNVLYANETLRINNTLSMISLEVVSISGSVMHQEVLNASLEATILLPKLPQGMYLARVINTDGSIEVKRFMIQ